jgi:hypothetical protein
VSSDRLRELGDELATVAENVAAGHMAPFALEAAVKRWRAALGPNGAPAAAPSQPGGVPFPVFGRVSAIAHSIGLSMLELGNFGVALDLPAVPPQFKQRAEAALAQVMAGLEQAGVLLTGQRSSSIVVPRGPLHVPKPPKRG